MAGRPWALAAVLAVGLAGLAIAPDGVRAQMSVASVVNPAPFWESAQRAGGTGFDAGYAVTVAEDGRVLIAGAFSDTAYFPTPDDSIALTSAGSTDVFVAELSPDGSAFEWAQRAGGVGSDRARSVAVAGDGTVVVAGRFMDTADFPTSNDDSATVTSQDSYDLFVATLAEGDSYFSWVQGAGGTGNDAAESVAVGPDGSIRVAGRFEKTAYFPASADDSLFVTSDQSLDSSAEDVYVAALSVDDSYFSWVQRAGGSRDDWAESVVVDEDGSALIAGRFRDVADFPTREGGSITLNGQSGTSGAFVARMNTDDSFFSWAQRVGGAQNSYAESVAVGPSGTVIVAGNFAGTAYFPTADDSIALTSATPNYFDAFVAALNPDGTAFEWAQRAGGDTDVEAESVAVTADGTVVMAGHFTGTTYFPTADDSIALTSPPNGRHAYLAYMKPGESVFSWVQQIEGTSSRGLGVAIGKSRQAIVTGRFGNAAYFPTVDDSLGLRSTGSQDVFLSSLQIPTVPSPPVPPGPVVPPSPPVNVAGVTGDAEATVSWSPTVSPGSFAVTNYQVQVSPGGGSCLVGAGQTSCTVTGLSNGSEYTARVRALTGAGWGSWSEPSDPFTPVAKSIMISGSRGEVRGRAGITVRGSTSGFAPGAVMRPWMRFPGQVSYQKGEAKLSVDEDGGFTWQRQTGKKIYVSVRTSDGHLRSNRLIIPTQ